jgi:hypothetical protein
MGGNFALIREAIERKAQVFAIYDGYPRRMCPHLLGWKHGTARALFYQFGGSSSRGIATGGGVEQNWRCMFVEDLSNVTLAAGEWFTAPNYNDYRQTCIGEIVAEAAS